MILPDQASGRYQIVPVQTTNPVCKGRYCPIMMLFVGRRCQCDYTSLFKQDTDNAIRN